MRNILRRRVGACALALMGFMYASGAEAQPMPNDNELQLTAGFFHAQDSDAGNANVDLSYGRFLANNHWEFGGRVGYQGIYNDNAPDVWNASVVPFFDYHFYNVTEDDRVVPFVGGFVGMVFNDDDFDGTTGPELGAKFFMSRSTFATMRYRYEWFFDNYEVGDERAEGNHVFTVGLGYLWNCDDATENKRRSM
ncbi:MAG: hypothetical protein IT290_05410 [Deltaproteobacteria bacterium]|nr:hypothetical protein [Deltaproteobacteria bacterium]